ncbi:hypothetical protein CAV_0475 [Campylobacter avium LMG 24591]|uniref:Uncharacterized protein n=1 Tax=Campylobacter avium LMG 24591 TaxID=522484 RepID=A0A222MWJ8_9BACT|nr:hypothetical protein [Campylobacter avium]ASQ30141.1 hypothetical protein CAV_0475 [Campylobacter avium LMG 24591]OYD79240.1 hypothetical protein CAV8706_0476 [Campylobacter avium]
MKVDNASIYTQNLAGSNSAKDIKESEQSFDTVLENEIKTSGIKAEDIKDWSDLYTYIGDRQQEKLGQTFANEEAAKKHFLITAASFVSRILLINQQNPNGSQEDFGYFFSRPDLWQEASSYGNTDEIKQELINTISLLQSDIGLAWLPSKESYEEFKARKQEGADFLKDIYKELFNEEPVVPKFETLVGEGAGSGIDISAAIKEFLNKPFENEEEDELIELIKELYKYKEKQESKIQESELKTLQDIGLKESFDIEKLALKERFTKEKQSIENFSLSLLLQSL